jgi:hypothetical protein
MTNFGYEQVKTQALLDADLDAKISIAQLKVIAAASADFAAFKVAIAAL